MHGVTYIYSGAINNNSITEVCAGKNQQKSLRLKTVKGFGMPSVI